MKKVLITGFEKFGQYVENPTNRLCQNINGKIIGEYEIITEILSTKILPELGDSHGKNIINKVIEEKIDLILSFGMSSDVEGLRIESRGINIIDNLKYALPHEQGKEIVFGGEKELLIDFSQLYINDLIKELQNNSLPVEMIISNDAGSFCCNALIYDLLHHMKCRNLNIPFLFFHCSCTPNSIKDILNFDKNKLLISDEQLESYVQVILLNI